MPVQGAIRLGVVFALFSLLIGGDPFAFAQTTKRPPTKPAPKTVPQPAPKSVAAPTPPAPPPPEDLVVKLRYHSNDGTTTSTVSMKGDRQRIDYGPDMAVLQQCGVDRVVQVNDVSKKFLAVEKPGAGAPQSAARSPKKGGTVTYTTEVTDTGERKPLFGQSARHVKTVLTRSATPDACDKTTERVETDGWFIDAPAMVCAPPPRAVERTTADNCRDTIEYVDPKGPEVGYPLAYTITRMNPDGRTSTMSMDVTEFANTTLPESLFTVPDGHTEVANLAQLSASPDGTKRRGVTRVCTPVVTGKVPASIPADDLTDALVVSLGDVGLDAVRLSAGAPGEQIVEARSRECDYVLTTDVDEVRKPGKGMLSRVAGTDEDFGAKVDFKLAAPGSKKPDLSESERSGGSTLRTAIGAAKMVSRYVTPFGMLSQSFGSMSTFAAMAGGGATTPAMGQSADPVMNTVFMLVDRATGQKPEPPLVSEEAAVGAAMLKEVAAIAAFLSKLPRP